MVTYDCSGPAFDGLTCPYTGKPLHAVMHVASRGRVYFSAPDAYSTANVFPTPRAAYRAWNRVNGVEGLKDGQPVVCAYTGKPLVLKQVEGGFCYDNGFDPHTLLPRDKFLHYAAMRDGASPYPLSAGDGRVDAPAREGKVTKSMKAHADAQRVEPDDETIKTVEGIMRPFKDDLQPAPASVQVTKPGGASRKKRGK